MLQHRVIFVLIDAALELVPPEIQRNHLVIRNSRKRGKSPAEILLENPVHGRILRQLPDHQRRGRPDIVHTTLLTALYSPLFLQKHASISIHTRNDEIIEIQNEWRVPSSYVRFRGLMEQLLFHGEIATEQRPILKLLRETSLRDWIQAQAPSIVLLMEEDGKLIAFQRLGEFLCSEERPMVLIGAFQRSKVRSEHQALAHRVLSVYPGSLPTWTVLDRCVAAVEFTRSTRGAGFPDQRVETRGTS